MTSHSPNDTRYSIAALSAGMIAGAGTAGALFLLGAPLPLVAVAGVGVWMFFAASIKYTDQWERAVLMRLGATAACAGPGISASCRYSTAWRT